MDLCLLACLFVFSCVGLALEPRSFHVLDCGPVLSTKQPFPLCGVTVVMGKRPPSPARVAFWPSTSKKYGGRGSY